MVLGLGVALALVRSGGSLYGKRGGVLGAGASVEARRVASRPLPYRRDALARLDVGRV